MNWDNLSLFDQARLLFHSDGTYVVITLLIGICIGILITYIVPTKRLNNYKKEGNK